MKKQTTVDVKLGRNTKNAVVTLDKKGRAVVSVKTKNRKTRSWKITPK